MRKTENMILQVLSWFHAVLLFAGFYLLIPTLMQNFDKDIPSLLLEGTVLFLPVILSFYLIRKNRNIVLYLLFAIVITAVVFAGTHNYLTVICTGLIFLIRCGTRIEKGRIKKQMRDFPGGEGRFYDPQDWEIPTLLDKPRLIHWVLFVIQYFILIFSGHHQYLPGIFYLLLAEIVITFVYLYIDYMRAFVLQRQKIANLPTRMILKNGYMIFAGLLLAFLVMVLPSILYGKEPLTALYHEPKPMGQMEEMPLELEHDKADMGSMEDFLAVEFKEPPAWLMVMNEVFIWTASAAILFFALRGIWQLLLRLSGSFAEGEEDEVINLKLVKEEQKELRKTKRKQEQQMRHTPQYRIRKKYRKKILKGMKQRPAGSESPHELEEKAGLVNLQDLERIHGLYEKARYSPYDCTVEEERSFPG